MNLSKREIEIDLNAINMISRRLDIIQRKYAKHSVVFKEIETLKFHMENLDDNLHEVLYEVE